MKYIGIDQSFRSTGLVVIDDNCNLIQHKVFSTKPSDGDYFLRAKLMARYVADNIPQGMQAKTAIEGLAFSLRGLTLMNLAGLQFMIVNSVRENGYDMEVLTPSKVKKFATGSGKAKKPDMFAALPDDIKQLFSTVSKANGQEDLADAYWIARCLRDGL